jgi:uncharacterized surface protein with fasciclin (FAS1) repeats
MYPSKNIIENAVNSEDHTTFVAAVNAAGLAETLEGGGPFTVFAIADVNQKNGIAHVIDTVLMPKS